MILSLYRGLTSLGGPVISLYLGRRKARGKEDAARFHERLGRPRLPRPHGPLVWLHAASVGESVSMLPVIERLCGDRGVSVLVTTGTVTSARLMAQRLPPGALHQYAPVDRLAFVRSFLDHWRPDLALWAESEFWPNMLVETAARGVPLVLLNGRISERSFRGWNRLPRLSRRLLQTFTICLGQTEQDAQRLRQLGARMAESVGNLKLAAAPLPADPAMVADLAGLFGERPRWIAASTHPGEELIAAGVHRQIAAARAGLLTVVVPRHPERGPEVAALLRGEGLRVALRSAGEAPGPRIDAYVADTMGELGLFYRLCPIAFIGKSLAGRGGQNPLEPARLGCAVLFGPHMDNFTEIAHGLLAAGAAEQIADADALAQAVAGLIGEPALLLVRAQAARAAARAHDGVLDAVMERLTPFLDALAGARARA